MMLDFLDDDAYFGSLDEKRVKCKTEFVRRDRQDSQESYECQDGFQVPGVTSEYLYSIFSNNNSIKFTKSTESVSHF